MAPLDLAMQVTLPMTSFPAPWSSEAWQAWSLDAPPTSKDPYIKSRGFNGLINAEFASMEDRDQAVLLLQQASLENGQWVSADRPPAVRAAFGVFFGLRKILKSWPIPYNIKIDEESFRMRVGGELAISAVVDAEGDSVEYKWHGDWETWEELHKNEDVKALFKKSADIIQKAGMGKKGTGRGAK